MPDINKFQTTRRMNGESVMQWKVLTFVMEMLTVSFGCILVFFEKKPQLEKGGRHTRENNSM